MIAADKSGSGKTTLTTGIIRHLTNKGMAVAPFKCGPDYIDTLHIQLASGRHSYNLDTVMVNPDTVSDIFADGCRDADVAVTEGVMGIFDGVDSHTFKGSSADIASVIDSPIIMLLDCSGSSFTPAAIVRGIEQMCSASIKGVVLNNIASERHAMLVRNAIAYHTDSEVVGVLPKNADKLVESRHLGVKTALEIDEPYFDICAEFVSENVDIDTILQICETEKPIAPPKKLSKPDKVAYLAYDKAFQFYYNANIDYLDSKGFAIKYFSPLNGDVPEDADFIYLGGGYPELYARELAEDSMTSIFLRDYVKHGGFLYAECGGLMYLSNGIHTDEGFYKTAGVIDAECRMCSKRQALGYVRAEIKNDCMMGRRGAVNIGHEFHYSTLERYNGEFAYNVSRVTDGKKSEDGICVNNAFASYTHLHFLSDNPFISNMIDKITGK